MDRYYIDITYRTPHSPEPPPLPHSEIWIDNPHPTSNPIQHDYSPRTPPRTPDSPRVPNTPHHYATLPLVTKPGTSRNAGKVGYPRGYVVPNYPTPETSVRVARGNPICGRPRTGKCHNGPGTCLQHAGYGTDHYGYGPCKWHGGNTPSVAMNCIKEMIVSQMRRYYGSRREIGPHEALLEEVQYTAGHVRWLRDTIRWLGGEPDGPEPENNPRNRNFDQQRLAILHQQTNMGAKPSVWLEMYHRERRHLIMAAKAAIDAGVAERQVKLAEDQGKLLAMVVMKILNDPGLQLTPQQLALAPGIARHHLLEQAERPSDDDPTAPPESMLTDTAVFAAAKQYPDADIEDAVLVDDDGDEVELFG